MNKDSRLLPALERPKLILQAFHLCKARTKVEDADTIWDSVADLAIPLGIPDLQTHIPLVEGAVKELK